MYILGLSFGYHDSAAAIIKDGVVLAASAEERFSRIKHDDSFPYNSIKFCLEFAGIDASELDAVIYYEDPINKFDRIVKGSFKNFPRGLEYLFDTFADWISRKKFFIKRHISESTGVNERKIHYCEHHLSHAASAYYPSRFDQATVIAIDGVGERDCAAVYMGEGGRLSKLYSIEFPNSLGLFYSAITAYLGFEVNEGEYKVMGMSGFGKPTYFKEMMNMFILQKDGSFKLDQSYFELFTPIDSPFTNKLVELFGTPRNAHSPFRIGEGDNQRFADIAASAQKCAEQVILHIVSKAVERTGIKNVCLAGGVALNSLANGKIAKELGCKLFIQPAAGDSGSALGCALEHYFKTTNAPKNSTQIFSAYLGKKYSDAVTIEALERSHFKYTRYDDDKLVEVVADVLSKGGVVGWFQGRSEWGPRALGNRSILANPTMKNMQEIVNERVKFREPFRPFAPMVVAEEACEYFDLSASVEADSPDCFMLSVCKVNDDKQEVIPAVTHVDKTARVQALYKEANPRMYKLLKAFKQKSGVPILMNTSFNLKDEPVVEEPRDALKTFFYAGMDLLVLDNFVVTKEYKI